MLSVATVRTAALVICVAGIAGMIVTSVLNHNGAAVTFGLITAVAVLCSMVAKSVAGEAERRLGGEPGDTRADGVPRGGSSGGPPAPDADRLADLVERRIQAAVAAGADEATIRQLVGEAVRLGRTLAPD